MKVSKYFLLLTVLVMTACGLKLVKDEKYISTEQFRVQAVEICITSKKYKNVAVKSRNEICEKDAAKLIADAEHKFREYKADEHNYRLCRSKFSNIKASDKCFMEKQANYYKRELATYKKKLN